MTRIPSRAVHGLFLGAVLLWCLSPTGCGQMRRFHGDPIPEGADNPLEIRYEGGTIRDAVGAIVRSLSDLGLSATQVRRDRGYVQTNYINVSAYVRSVANAYPARELFVQYQIAVAETPRPAVQRILIRAVYRPTLSDRDRLVPLDHPGFTLALRMGDHLELNLINAGMRIVEARDETG